MLILCNTWECEIGYFCDMAIGGYELHNIIELFILGPDRNCRMVRIDIRYHFKPVPLYRIRALLQVCQICVAFKHLPRVFYRVRCQCRGKHVQFLLEKMYLKFPPNFFDLHNLVIVYYRANPMILREIL